MKNPSKHITPCFSADRYEIVPLKHTVPIKGHRAIKTFWTRRTDVLESHPQYHVAVHAHIADAIKALKKLLS